MSVNGLKALAMIDKTQAFLSRAITTVSGSWNARPCAFTARNSGCEQTGHLGR